MSQLAPSRRERSKRTSKQRKRRRRQRSGLAMAMAIMLGSLLAVLLAVSATRTHAAKMQQRRAAESMQLEQMRLAAMMRLHQVTNESPSGDPKVVIDWNPADLPQDVTDASEQQQRIVTGWRVVSQFAKAETTSPSTSGQPTAGDAVNGDLGKRDVIVEVVSAHSRQKQVGTLDLGGVGKSKERSRDDRQRDSQNESELP